MLVDAEHLKLTLNGRTILSDVGLHLEYGQIYGLLGPNGAGKSTTIALILGLYQPDDGRLECFGEASASGSRTFLERIGVMPEHAGFYGWMRAGDYLAWYAGLYGDLQKPVPELLELVGLRAAQQRTIDQFSRGMLQRLGLARALLHAPELLVLDEPTNGLDPRGRREIHDLLLTLARDSGVGILLCTHLLDDVDRLCDRIGIINQGRTVVEGPLVSLLGKQGLGQKFRLRMETIPDLTPLHKIKSVEISGQDGSWWHLSLNDDAEPAAIWKQLQEHGWKIREIHSEGGGLEDFYLNMTGAANPVSQLDAT